MTSESVQNTDTIELKVVLVEKSFSEINGNVTLTLVTVVAQSSEKIASLKATLKRFSSKTVLSLYYRGVRCAAKKTVDYYLGLGTDGLWQARLMQEIQPGQTKTAIDISNDGKKTVLMVPSSLSISCFRDILYHRLAIQPDRQHLLINDRIVNEKSRIRDHNSRNSESTIVLLDETRSQVDPSVKYIEFSRHLIEPIHRKKRNEATSDIFVHEVVNGLNIEGVCCTPNCSAFGNNAIYPVGLEAFDMCIDSAFCPLCNGEMYITNAGFHNCKWRIQGVKQTGSNKHSTKTISRQIDDEYVRCDPSRGTVPGRWSRLMLQASPIGVQKQCAVCRSLIESDDFLILLCGDYMHLSCHQAWKNIDSKCPSCLEQVES
eukprot:g4441.t1